MWNVDIISNNIVRDAFNQCRRRMSIDFYRTRNPLNITNTIYSFSFLYALGGRSQEELNSYFNLKTIATPRNIDTQTGVDNMSDELETLSRTLNVVIVNTINNKEVGDALAEQLIADGAQHLTDYTMPLTQSPYHRVGLLYEEITATNGELRKYYYLFTNKMNDEVVSRLAGCMCSHMHLFGTHNSRIATALLQYNQELYENLIQSVYEETQSERHRTELQRTLEQVASYCNRRLEERLTQQIAGKQDDIDSYISSLNTLYRDMYELRQRLLGVRHNSGTADEVTQFLITNADNISFAKLHDGYLYLRYRTPMLYWDEDVFKTLRNSNRDNPINNQSPADQQLIDDIFDTRKVVMWFDSGFRYSLTNTGFAHYNVASHFSDVPTAKGLSNPHHFYYNCWGDNEPMILQAQSRNDTVVALAQIFAAIAGINLTDGIVLDKFINQEWESFRNVFCLELKETGEFITISQYRDRYYAEQRRQLEEQTQQAQVNERATQANTEFPFE